MKKLQVFNVKKLVQKINNKLYLINPKNFYKNKEI